MAVIEPTVKKIPLKADQYYQAVHAKKYIVLHHTAGGSAASSIAHWASNPDHIATPYVIDRDGTIYECYDPKYFAYHLGVKGNSAIEKASIGIEICSYGSLAVAKRDKAGKYKKGDYITYTDKVIAPDKAVKLPPFRPEINPFATKPDADYNATLWEKYTDEQIAALKLLLPYLMDRFKIPKGSNPNDFWEYHGATDLPPGIWSHSTVRRDKIDIFPQPEIVELVKGL